MYGAQIAKFSAYIFPETFEITDSYPAEVSKEDCVTILREYLQGYRMSAKPDEVQSDADRQRFVQNHGGIGQRIAKERNLRGDGIENPDGMSCVD